MDEVYLGIGTNLGNRKLNIENAVKKLKNISQIELLHKSSNYNTSPVAPGEQPDYLNSAVKIRTSLSPKGLLRTVKDIERKIGRKEKPPWTPRIIDIDILFYDKEIINTKVLKIPHPLLHKRNFVLKPLMEIASEFEHPKLKKSIRELWYENNRKS